MSIISRFPSGGGSSDLATATPSNVLKGYTFVGKDSDDIQTGTLELSGNAVVNHVIKGVTFYTTDAKTKLTGTMEVGNVSNLNLAVSSGRNITITWTNPYQQTARPYSGVYIKYSTSGNPGTGGTQIYKGTGNNTTSGGRSSATLTFPNLGTRYYISVYSYCVTSNGELLGTVLSGNITTGSSWTQTITSTQNVTVPSGYNYVDIFCVGGGGGGGANAVYSQNNSYAGRGGGGGYTTTVSNIGVSGGQTLYCAIGGGGTGATTSGSSSNPQGGTGGTTYVSRGGSWLCSASGGYGGQSANYDYGNNSGNGGSGGGGTAYSSSQGAGSGGTNGGNGGSQGYGTGQGYTTTAFAENSGTVYSGGGGGGGYGYTGRTAQWGGSGGNYGGGAGGYGAWRSGGSSSEPEYTGGENGHGGSANSGGGGGGGGGAIGNVIHAGGAGGSGIILIRFK